MRKPPAIVIAMTSHKRWVLWTFGGISFIKVISSKEDFHRKAAKDAKFKASLTDLAEAQRTQREFFLFGGERPPNKKCSVPQDKKIRSNSQFLSH
jgi:hypothetical protein